MAADMSLPVKAPPVAAPPPLDIHGFIEFDYEGYLINPQGQALIQSPGAETLVGGLNWNLYKSKTGFINNVTVGGFIAADFFTTSQAYWGSFQPSMNEALFDGVGSLTASVTFGQYWTLEENYFWLIFGDVPSSAAGAAAAGSANSTGIACTAGCAAGAMLQWNTLKLALNDSFTGWPLTFNPYVTWWQEVSSGPVGVDVPFSAACFSCTVHGYDFFIGMTPTLNLKAWGLPQLTFKAPTYVTVGPADFWYGGAAGGADHGNVGVFTIGLTAVYSLNWIPANYGNWYIKGGFQWYDIINDNLIADNIISDGDASRNIFVAFGGLGVGF